MKQAINTLDKLENLSKFYISRNHAAFTTIAFFIKKIRGMVSYVTLLSDESITEGLHQYSFSGSKTLDRGMAAVSLANTWLIPHLEDLSIGQRDNITISMVFWAAVDQLVYGNYVDCSDTSSSPGQRQMNVAAMQLVFELTSSLAMIRGRDVALLSLKINFEDLYEQKQWLLSQCNHSSAAEGLVNFLDSLQDGIVRTSVLTEKEVFPHLGNEE